ncbi:hypothetical protein ZWY2020_002696 [Hordeum vulgare]|nr:hypothetical protein ZWY2020_002696 [Hordeum vulgare]
MPHAGTDSSSRLDLRRCWFEGRYKNDGRPGSVLAQRLVGAPLTLIKCDDCPSKVQVRMSTVPEHPGWVFIKCPNDGENGCDFWYWEEEYIDILIERKLVDVHALLAIIEARNKNSALVATIYAIDESRCEEATSISLNTKKIVERKIEPPQINNKCIEKALIKLTGAVMEVGFILKCLLVVLVFFGLAILGKV